MMIYVWRLHALYVRCWLYFNDYVISKLCVYQEQLMLTVYEIMPTIKMKQLQ